MVASCWAMGRNSLEATKARRMLAVRAARAARLPALFRVFFFLFVFFVWLAEAGADFPAVALDFPATALRDWLTEGANASAESTTTSHRDARRGADEGEDKTMSSLYSAFARSARRQESAGSLRQK